MADHYTLRESWEGEHVQLEVWGGLERVRTGYHVGDLIEIYSDDERDTARIHVKTLNYDLSEDLWRWMQAVVYPVVPPSQPMSGLAAWLRCSATHVCASAADAEAFRAWANEVDSAVARLAEFEHVASQIRGDEHAATPGILALHILSNGSRDAAGVATDQTENKHG